jgi:alpha-L-glutamate ligase-like protein
MFNTLRGLRARGVMGMNRRNCDYTLMYNPRRLYPLVDDKLQTKHLAEAAGIAVPPLYGAVEAEWQIRHLGRLLENHPEFVIKPAHGSGGDGILVIDGRRKGLYHKANGAILSEAELKYHVSNVLSGMYSLGGHPDQALVEYRVRFGGAFATISYQGVPDIRIIVFLGVPVMAMTRLPTQLSDGKANLHQGAIGAGIDIASGLTVSAVWQNQPVMEHTDTGESLLGFQVPYWDQLLDIAARCYELTGLGYLGVDLVLDRTLGPLMLEMNARPGLNIQIANKAGLLPRLERVKSCGQAFASSSERVAFAKQQFACAVE